MLDAVSQSALCKTTALSCVTFSFQWNYSTHERVEKRRGENSQKNTLFNMFFHYQVHAHATLWNQQVPSVKITDSPANTASSEQTLHLWTLILPSDPRGKPKAFKNGWSDPIGSGLQTAVQRWPLIGCVCRMQTSQRFTFCTHFFFLF